MAFTNGLRSPPNESSFPTSNYPAPIRPIGSHFSSNVATTSAERAQLHRRFTTNALPTLPTLSSFGPLSPIGQQRRQAAEPPSDLAAAVSLNTLRALALSCSAEIWTIVLSTIKCYCGPVKFGCDWMPKGCSYCAGKRHGVHLHVSSSASAALFPLYNYNFLARLPFFHTIHIILRTHQYPSHIQKALADDLP